MGEVLAFAPRPPAGDWTASERGLLLLLTQHLEKSYGEVDAVFGQTDSGDPWYVVTDANQEVLVHVARIEGQFVVHDAAVDMFHQVGSLWSALRQMLASGAPEEAGGVVVAFNPASREAQSFLSLVIAVGLYLELREAGFGDIARLDFGSLPRNGDLAVEGVTSKLIAALNLDAERVGAQSLPQAVPTNENTAPPAAKSEGVKAPALETPSTALAGLMVTKAHAQTIAPAAPSSEPPAQIQQHAMSTAEGSGDTQGFAGTRSVISGTPGNDNLVGSAEGEVIRGGAGDDRIDGAGARSGVDRIDGGAGNDRIVMGSRVVASGGEGGDTFLISAKAPENKADSLLGVVLDYAAAKGDHLAVLGKGQLTVVSTTAVSNILAAQEAALGEATAHLVTDVTHTVAGARVGFDIDGDGREDVYILLGGANTRTFVIGTTIEASHAAAPTPDVTLVGQSTTDVGMFGDVPAR
ncbi:hypothetical protein B7G68_06955 [Caulobacter segnis]|uniref:Calcium-binding protein n=2 Tax=Caulobacter segnis TaxID=88688 RepID=D5VIN2_CAUST|nr:calcium-binding protein [Caulobacter segnis]ADG09848.1 conserved hypothetical protein [Caulobacter segnis ATCC 21756]AVQ01609.1 hypothetical protein B7G68_06955 [Caulobacter segnis]